MGLNRTGQLSWLPHGYPMLPPIDLRAQSQEFGSFLGISTSVLRVWWIFRSLMMVDVGCIMLHQVRSELKEN